MQNKGTTHRDGLATERTVKGDPCEHYTKNCSGECRLAIEKNETFRDLKLEVIYWILKAVDLGVDLADVFAQLRNEGILREEEYSRIINRLDNRTH